MYDGLSRFQEASESLWEAGSNVALTREVLSRG